MKQFPLHLVLKFHQQHLGATLSLFQFQQVKLSIQAQTLTYKGNKKCCFLYILRRSQNLQIQASPLKYYKSHECPQNKFLWVFLITFLFLWCCWITCSIFFFNNGILRSFNDLSLAIFQIFFPLFNSIVHIFILSLIYYVELCIYVFANAVVVEIFSKTSGFAIIIHVSFQGLMYAQPLTVSQYPQDR